MNKVKCTNGHFYDSERFQSCPICGSEGKIDIYKKQSSRLSMEISKTEPLLTSETQEKPVGSKETVSPKVDELAPTELIQQQDERRLAEEVMQAQRTAAQITNDHNDTENASSQDKNDESRSPLRVAIEETGARDISPLPKTVSYYDMDETEPPVGWLVCIKGFYTGRSFECKVGRNRIGRAPNMEIALIEDTAISREPHAILIYEPRQRHFYLQAGSGKGLIYLNGNMLFEHEELKPYDKIFLGNSEFVFLPLCGPQFTWDEYIAKG